MKANHLIVSIPLALALASAVGGCGQEERAQAAQDISSEIDQLASGRDQEGFDQVTRERGALIVTEGDFEAESAAKPWSSWWYPLRDTYLFDSDGHGTSPLEKYDRYVARTHGRDPGAARFEKEKLYDPNASAWEGLCNAWAAASLMASEPTHSIQVGGVTFGVGDLKALLVKSYENVPGLKQYGQRNNGDRKSVFDDIYPDQFHKLLQSELFEKRRPFIMDKDPSLAVWNTPIWKTQVTVARDPSDPHVMHVTSWIFGASPFVDSYNFVGTLSVVFQYTYDLHGYLRSDGTFLVKYGEWTGDSADDHPDFLSVLPDSEDAARKDRASENQSLLPSLVDEILAVPGSG